MKQSKQWIIVICALALSLSGRAVPEFINYQGRLTSPTGAPINSSPANPVNLVFRLYDAPTNGVLVWTQVNTNVAVQNGLFSVLLTSLNETILPATNQIARWLEVEVRTGAITNILQPRKEIVSVAYAIRAGDADMVDGKHASELGGITNEVDPTVTNWVKDGVSWVEIRDIAGDMPAGFADGVDDVGITMETDPTVTNWVKDGVSWVELKGQDMPAGFADDIDNVGITNWLELTTNGMPAGFADGIDNVGITVETDPTVVSWVKDGESWTELKGQGMPMDFADDVDNVGLTVETDPTVTNWVKDGVSWADIRDIAGDMPDGFKDGIDDVGITNWVELTTNGMPAGFADGIDDVGITMETDPTVVSWVKDGESWTELKGQGMPMDFADDVDNVGITNWMQLKAYGMPAGFADDEDNAGITNEVDPTVVSWVKDGESWAELKGQGMPAGFADDVDNVGITAEDDPQVGANTVNYVPRWDGSALVKGAIYDPGSGNIGIGTASPGAKLDIGGLGHGSMAFRAGLYGDAANYSLRLNTIETGELPGFSAVTYAWRINNAGSANDREVMAFKYNGNVGIGTPSPTAPLSFANVAGKKIYFYDDGTSAHGIDLQPGLLRMFAGGSADSIAFGYESSDVFNEWVRIKAGNVGIGTTSPGYKLDVNGDAIVRGTLGISGGDYRIQPDWNYLGHYPFLAFIAYPPTISGICSVLIPPMGGFVVTDWQNSRPNMWSDGVYGHLSIAGNYFSASDDRIKFNEQKLDYGLAQVMALEPKRYDRAEYEYDPETEELVIHPEIISRTNEIGLVAQDVQQVIPEAVRIPGDENRQLWSISYESIIPVLVKAIQEQQAQIEKLKQEIQIMKSGI